MEAVAVAKRHEQAIAWLQRVGLPRTGHRQPTLEQPDVLRCLGVGRNADPKTTRAPGGKSTATISTGSRHALGRNRASDIAGFRVAPEMLVRMS